MMVVTFGKVWSLNHLVPLTAGLIVVGRRVASPAAIARAETSEKALRGELIKLMRGDGFHDFLISGADDRLSQMGW